MSEGKARYNVGGEGAMASLYRAGDRLSAARAILIAASHFSESMDKSYTGDRFDQLLNIAIEELKESEQDYHQFHAQAREQEVRHDNELFGETETAYGDIEALCGLVEGAELSAANKVGASNVLLTLIGIAESKFHCHMMDAVNRTSGSVSEEGRGDLPH